MTGYRQTLLVLLLTILSGAAVAQNNTNSPYTLSLIHILPALMPWSLRNVVSALFLGRHL